MDALQLMATMVRNSGCCQEILLLIDRIDDSGSLQHLAFLRLPHALQCDHATGLINLSDVAHLSLLALLAEVHQLCPLSSVQLVQP